MSIETLREHFLSWAMLYRAYGSRAYFRAMRAAYRQMLDEIRRQHFTSVQSQTSNS